MMFDIETNSMGIAPSLCNKLFRTELLKESYNTADGRVTLGEDAMCAYPTLFRAESIYIFENTHAYHYRQDQVSMVNRCDAVLLQRVVALSDSLNASLSTHGKEIRNQLDCYIASCALYAVRQVLLLNKDLSSKERIEKVNEFLENEVIKQALLVAYDITRDFKMRLKIKLAVKKRIASLRLLLSLNGISLRLKKQQ
jgi:hypothetical protein